LFIWPGSSESVVVRGVNPMSCTWRDGLGRSRDRRIDRRWAVRQRRPGVAVPWCGRACSGRCSSSVWQPVLGSIASVLYRNDIAATASRLPDGIRSAVEESIGSAVGVGATGPPPLPSRPPSKRSPRPSRPSSCWPQPSWQRDPSCTSGCTMPDAKPSPCRHRSNVNQPRQTTTRRPRGPACHAHDEPGTRREQEWP
jgi:hypothetical protein